MECPFELPVEKKPDSKEFEGLWIVVDKVGMIIGFPLKDFEADYIVQAINSHEKMKTALEEIEAVSCGEKQVAEDDSEGMGWIYKRIQALKEAEQE